MKFEIRSQEERMAERENMLLFVGIAFLVFLAVVAVVGILLLFDIKVP